MGTSGANHRRMNVLHSLEAVMGKAPACHVAPTCMRIHTSTEQTTYRRLRISYTLDSGPAVPAYVLLPHCAQRLDKQLGVLALMPTHEGDGHGIICGVGPRKDVLAFKYGEELAQLGFPVIAPAYPLLGSYQPDWSELGYGSGTMKAIVDNMGAIDVLQQLAGRQLTFAAIGHSLGGHNALFTAAFEPRIQAVVTSCGFDSFREYAPGGYADAWRMHAGWTHARYMPRLAEYVGRVDEIPFDFSDVLAEIAPRPVRVVAPHNDTNFNCKSVDRVVARAREACMRKGVPEQICLCHPHCGHEFPTAVRQEAYEWLQAVLPENKLF